VTHRGIVLIGASAGGLEAPQRIWSAITQDLEAAILIVLHTANHSGSLLPEIRERACSLPVSHPGDGDRIHRGRVYIAPPGFHMVTEEGFFRVLLGPRENLQRPATTLSFGQRLLPTVAGRLASS
jgi:two-component system, chemotaxis family, protein-glutamate methylesterase/glutaminase